MISKSFIKKIVLYGTVTTGVCAFLFISIRNIPPYHPIPPTLGVVDLHLSQYPEQQTPEENISSGGGSKKNNLAATVLGTRQKTSCAISMQFNAQEGNPIKYQITLTNRGGKTCRNASLSVYYPENVSFISSVPKATASNYYWEFGNLKDGDVKTVKLNIASPQNYAFRDIEACATADNGKDACGNAVPSGIPISSPLPVTASPAPTPVQTPENPKENTITSRTNTSQSLPVAETPSENQNIQNTSANKEYGSWVWDSPLAMSEERMQSVIAGAKANHINTLYITVDDYLPINDLSDGEDKEAKKKSFSLALLHFISLAEASGIRVDAEAGWRDWSEDGEAKKGMTIIDFVLEYNRAHPGHEFRGFQYDVEPYLLPRYNNNKAAVLKNFVAFIEKSVQRLSTEPITFSVVIPHFYDETQAWTPSFSYGGVTDFAYGHLLRILDRRPGSSIILMSYRNTALGDNGTISLSNTEIVDASTGEHSTQIIVGQETGNVEPSLVTFYGKSKKDYLEQLNIIHKTFDSYKNFGGVAVHYIDPFLELK